MSRILIRRISLVALVGICVPLSANAEETTSTQADEIPKRPERQESAAKPPSRIRLPTLLGGIGFSAAFWGLDAGAAHVWPDNPGFSYLRTPLIGPWQALAHNSCSDALNNCGFYHYFDAFWFVLSGLAQAGGLGVALEAALVPTQSATSLPVVPEAGTSPSESRPPAEEQTPVVPGGGGKPLFFLPRPIVLGRGGYGIGMGGVF